MAGSVLSCPECQKELKTATPLPAGKRVRCPKCQAVFVIPGPNGRSASALKAKDGNGVPARKSRPVEDDEDEDRPARRRQDEEAVSARKPSRKAAPIDDDLEVADEDDEEEDRPRKKKKKKAKKGNGLMIGLIGGGVLLLAIVAVLLFIWPGFLRSGSGLPAGTGNENLLAYLPPNCSVVAGFSMTALLKLPNADQQLDQAFAMWAVKAPPPPGLPPLLKQADKGVIGVDSTGKRVVFAVMTKTPYTAEKMRQSFNAPAGFEGKQYFTFNMASGMVTVAMPNDRVVVIGNDLEDTALPLASDGTTARVSSDIQSQVQKMQNSLGYVVAKLEGKLKEALSSVRPEQAPADLASLLPALQQAKLMSGWIEVSAQNDYKFNLGLTCGNDQDATLVKEAVSKLWNEKVLPILPMLGMFIPQQGAAGAAISALTEDLRGSFQVQTQGPLASASIQVSGKTMDELNKLQGNAGAGRPGMGQPMGQMPNPQMNMPGPMSPLQPMPGTASPPPGQVQQPAPAPMEPATQPAAKKRKKI